MAACGLHGDPDPRLGGRLVDNAGPVIRCHRRACDHDVRRPAHRLDVQVVRAGRPSMAPATPVTTAGDTHGATDATHRSPFHQHAFEQPSGALRDEVLCEAVDTLMTAGMALMGRCAVVEVAIVLVRGRLTPWTPVSDDPSLALDCRWRGQRCGSTGARHRVASLPWRARPAQARLRPRGCRPHHPCAPIWAPCTRLARNSVTFFTRLCNKVYDRPPFSLDSPFPPEYICERTGLS